MKRLGVVFLACAVCVAPVPGQTPEQKRDTVTYLRKLQTPSGGFLPAMGQEMPSLRATSAAARALKYFGSPLQDTQAAQQFVKRCFRPDNGGFVDRPDSRTAPDVTTTAVGLMAVGELQMPLDDYRNRVANYLGEHARDFPDIRIAAAGFESIHARPAQAETWLKQLVGMRNPDGTYGKADDRPRETGSVVVTILRLGGAVNERDRVMQVLKAGQRPDGGFSRGDSKRSDLESTYRIMRAFVMLKEKPDDTDRVRKFIASCRNADGGYGVEPGQASSVSGTYYAGIILHWLDRR